MLTATGHTALAVSHLLPVLPYRAAGHSAEECHAERSPCRDPEVIYGGETHFSMIFVLALCGKP